MKKTLMVETFESTKRFPRESDQLEQADSEEATEEVALTEAAIEEVLGHDNLTYEIQKIPLRNS